jgi:LysM repeat protein
VVAGGALLVTFTNWAAGKESGGFLFGYWGGDNKVASVTGKMVGQLNRKDNLVFVPLNKASSSPDLDFKEEEDNQLVIQGPSVMASMSAKRDPEEEGGVKIYEVKEGDNISSIAAKYKITANTILWANDIENIDAIKPGDKIFILPVAGLSYVVQENDNLDYIAQKYHAEKEKIIAFNDLPANGKIEKGQELIIPEGWKETPQTASGSTSGIARRQYATPQGGAPAISGWRRLDGRAGTGHGFPYGYCTWYVAQRRYVPWGGNAGTWLYHAKAGGYQTGKTPRPGSIVVTSESWWGHVAIVESVSGGSVTISEMNYVRWGKVSRRTIAANSRVIKGYIY